MIRHRIDSISDFARQGYNLRFTCMGCGHVIDASAREMMQNLHRRRLSLQIEAIERRAKCSSCDAKSASVTAVVAEW